MSKIPGAWNKNLTLSFKITMPKTAEEIMCEIRANAIEDTKTARELGIKFFFHWTILSGATLTLLITFLSNVDIKKIQLHRYGLHIKIAIIVLILSLILAIIRNFIMIYGIHDRANANHKIANEFSKALFNKTAYKSETPKDKFKIYLHAAEYLAIITFIIGIIEAYRFIAKVIF